MAEIKDTLLMGQTTFEMRGNLGVKEPNIEKKWEDMDLYNQILKQNEGKKEYTLHDGPPYANGEIHSGHAMNKILKDFVVRYKNMTGYKSLLIPGWDTHGLPIENALQKKGVKRKEMSKADFRRLCEEYAFEQVGRQMAGFKRLGVLADWEHPYITLQHEFESDQIKVFAKMAEKGLIYKGMKPVYWSPSSESALAEAEIEYQDKVDTSIYFKFPLVEAEGVYENASLLVWTTTPWTLPGNLAVSVGPEIEYLVANTAKGKLIFGAELAEKLTSLLELGEVEVLARVKGIELAHLKYRHFLNGRISPVIYGEHVTTSDGTGLVHTAPGLGEDDFLVGKQFGLGLIDPVDDRGVMNAHAGKYEGLFYEDGSKQIVLDMEANGDLIKAVQITHSYPHDWRTKKPVIFRSTPQWFASIDPIKNDILDAIKGVNWSPKWGEIRISNMIADRHDWCISRQRVWGVPIPVFYAENGEAILDQEVLAHIADLFNEYGSNVWFEREAKDLLPEGYTHPGSPNGEFKKETDIMDVWFDSGSSHKLLERRGLSYPADLYLEGSDQYRGWFNSSIITGVATTGQSPYKTVVSHGFIMDEQGRKMSKSLGNTVSPSKICNEFGADVLRFWVSSVEYQSDVRIGNNLIKQVSEAYRKIRNTIRFMLANTSDFNPANSLSFEELENVDKYVLIKWNKFLAEVRNSYEEFAFGDVYRRVNAFVANELSSFFLDFTKDILYIETKDSKRRLSVQTVMYEIVTGLMKLLTPILPHTMSEAYDTLPYKEKADIALCDIPEVKDYSNYAKLEESFDKFMKYRDVVLKELEEARNQKVIGKSFTAKLNVTLDSTAKEVFETLDSNIAQILIVSQLETTLGDEFKVSVEAANGCTCTRCRMIVPTVDEQELCPRCATIVKKYFE